MARKREKELTESNNSLLEGQIHILEPVLQLPLPSSTSAIGLELFPSSHLSTDFNGVPAEVSLEWDLWRVASLIKMHMGAR